jgi:hypothetical protein
MADHVRLADSHGRVGLAAALGPERGRLAPELAGSLEAPPAPEAR